MTIYEEFNAGRGDAPVTRRSLLGGAAADGVLGALAAMTPGTVAAAPVASTASPAVGATASGRRREYRLSVESFEHNLVPTGVDQMMGAPVTGSTYQALGFRAYTPGFGRPLPADDRPAESAPTVASQVRCCTRRSATP